MIITRLASKAFNPVAQTVIATTVFDRAFPILACSSSCPTISGLIGLVASTVEVRVDFTSILPDDVSGTVSKRWIGLVYVVELIVVLLSDGDGRMLVRMIFQRRRRNSWFLFCL